MEFLAGYVRVVHSDRYYRTVLVKYRGASYLDIITVSDIAYVVSLIKNSGNVWLNMKTPEGKKAKPLYTTGEGLKREYGVTTWNVSGKKYYEDAKNAGLRPSRRRIRSTSSFDGIGTSGLRIRMVVGDMRWVLVM